MLRTLAIRNLAIIDELDLEFGPGLNVLTGETGAGKSIIVGALSIVLGGRTTPDIVRSGTSRAVVDAVFDVGGIEPFLTALGELGYDATDGELLLTREVQDNGKSLARIGGRPAAISALREVGEWLVDLHGQHEHQSLLSVKRHGELLDEWGGSAIREASMAVAAAWNRMRDLQARLERHETNARERLRQMDLYRFQVQEIASAALHSGEEEELQTELLRLRNVERLREGIAEAVQWLSAGPASAVDALACAARELDGTTGLDSTLSPVAQAVHTARYDMEEATRTLTRYLEELDADPDRLDAIQHRLSTIADLKRKYGATVDEVLAYGEQAAAELAELEQYDTNTERLRAEIEKARRTYDQSAAHLSRLRHEVAVRFQDAVEAELADVALEQARFEVSVADCVEGPNGRDAVEFLFAANAGEPVRPLARIASGGEISRVMLAIKSAAASRSPLPTMVFDEIDAGIGGRTAEAIGRKMHLLASHAQVICITHLAQIAAAARQHFAISKVERDSRTVVEVRLLDEDERVEELVRMLAGTQVTDAVREHVRSMLKRDTDAAA